MKKELLEDALTALAASIAALEDVSIELDGYEHKLVTYMIQQTRDNIETINRMIERTKEKV